MREKAWMLIIIISLLFLVGTVGAEMPDNVTITGNSSWIVAGSGPSTYMVTVTNQSSGGVLNVDVSFEVNNTLGTLNPGTKQTDSNGIASSNFNIGTKSGTSTITIRVLYNGGSDGIFDETYIFDQNIDHDILSANYTPSTGIVEEEIPFTVSIKDKWGNPIDNRRGDNTVSLSVTCPLPNDCSFVDHGVDYGHSYTSQPVQGNLTIPIKFGTKSGLTTIIMSSIKDPVKDIDEQYVYIDTLAGDPALKVDISPASLTVPVNTGVFSFIYTISDKNNNPVANEPVHIVTSLGEILDTKTNAFGQTPLLSYGPKGTVYNAININATSGNLTKNVTVAFSTAETKNLALYVLPQSMPSLDVDPSSHADAVGKVVDAYGNPISGQTLAYSLTCSAADPTEDAVPHLTNYGGQTNNNGYVETIFIPGSFNSTTDKKGSCQLAANWNDNPSYPPQTVTLTWVNYPYVSIYTGVPQQTVHINDTIDVTISIVGSGKEPKGGPVSVMLDLDASSNFANQGNRVDKAKNATAKFVKNLSSHNALNQLGLVSYGDIDNEVLHLSPTDNHALVLSNINGTFLNMSGGVSGGITVERSIDEAVVRIMGPPPPNKVRAIVSLGDSAYTNNNGVLARLVNETWTQNQIRVFVILYLSETGSTGCGTPTDSKAVRMRLLAEQTQGKFYWGCSEAAINAAFADVAETLRRLSAENATMSVSFSNIAVNNTTSLTGSQVYDYIPVDIPAGLPPGVVSPPNATVNSNARTSIIWTNGNQSIVNQINEWPELKFNVGTIEIGKNWSATFRLKVKQPGCYNVFGTGGSELVFNGGSNNLSLPDLPICVVEEPDNQGFKNGTLDVNDLDTIPSASTNPPFTDFIPLQWNTSYNSTVSTNNATEYVYYCKERFVGDCVPNTNGVWNQVEVKTGIPTGDSSQSTFLDVRNFPLGTYVVWVHATAEDAVPADATTSRFTVRSASPYFIKLQ